MGRVSVSIPSEVVEQAKAAGLNISALATAALRRELDRLSKIAELDRHLDELESQLGPVPADEAAEAETWAERLISGDSDTRRTA